MTDVTPDPTARGTESAAWTEPVAVPSTGDVLRSLLGTVTQGRAVADESTRAAAELGRILLGVSDVAPAQKDWRFADPAWRENPVYRRIGQAYLTWAAGMERLAARGTGSGADRAKFAVELLTSTLAPTNTLLGNPAALKRTFDTGARNLVRGARNWLGDIRHNGGMPSMVDREALKVGRDMALTPGAVVQRDEFAELLQYRPTTDQVRSRPVLVTPPPIGRYYFLDLRPGRSFVEYAVSRGLQTFLLSWRNPGPAQSEWNLETYAARVLSAIDAVRDVTGSEDVHLIGFCAGGILNTTVLNHLAATAQGRVASASYAVTLLDFSGRAPIRAFSNAKLLAFARSRTRRAGVISARDMGLAFTWMRPNDLVWNYWVNNYLMGEDPPVFDILAWNADGTNLPAALHVQFLDMFERNTLCDPGSLSVLGTPVDLSTIKVPTFVTGATTDHLTPWKGCYRTTQLLSGPSTFVLSNAGHIQSLVNPPGNPKASYYAGPEPGLDPDAWLEQATRRAGSWWQVWADWVIERAGPQRRPPNRLGGRKHRPLGDAPGGYVVERSAS